MNEVGTVDAGFIQVKVRTVDDRIGLFIVSQRDAVFYFTLLPPAADRFSGCLRDACDGELGPAFSETVDTDSMQVKVSTVDDRIGLSVSGRDVVFHLTLNPVDAQKLSDLLHKALVSAGHLSR